MTSLKGMFTLAVGRMFRVETLTLVKIGAVLTGYVVFLFSLYIFGSPACTKLCWCNPGCYF
jgi:solute carrier family 35 protein F5